MPIAATLSRTLYDTLGDEAAEAMVDWMQRVDTQRSELRELNDLSFARIDARFGEARAEMDLRFTQVDTRFAELRAEIDTRFTRIDTRFAELRDEMHTGFATLEAKLDRRFAELIKWSFVSWVGSTVTLVVALAALARFAR
jgi:hypothetical protein